MNLFVFIAFFFAAVFGAETPPSDPPKEEVAAVRGRLAPLQLFSFVTEREFCGYLYRDAAGALAFTEMERGDRDGCTPQMPAGGIVPIASLHTHGAYDPDVPAEFPTVLDMQSDRSEGVNGYVATPGGRLWFIDSRRMVVHQICGPGCLPQDPSFREGDDGEIAPSYTYRALRRLEAR